MKYLILLIAICTVLSIKKPPDLDPPNSTTTSTNPPTTKTTSKTTPTTTTKTTTTRSTPSTTSKTTTKRATTSSTWDPPTTTVVYDEPGDCDFESDCQWKSSTTGGGPYTKVFLLFLGLIIRPVPRVLRRPREDSADHGVLQQQQQQGGVPG